MSLQNLAVVNTLQVLPFYDLDDREFSFVIGNWTGQFDELMTPDLYNLLSNPDKMVKLTLIQCLSIHSLSTIVYQTWVIYSIVPRVKDKGISLVHCNIRSLMKILTLWNDTLYSLDSRLNIIAITETRLSSNSISNLDVPNYNFFILIHPHV